jgi:flagellar hook-length control protein FliK
MTMNIHRIADATAAVRDGKKKPKSLADLLGVALGDGTGAIFTRVLAHKVSIATDGARQGKTGDAALGGKPLLLLGPKAAEVTGNGDVAPQATGRILLKGVMEGDAPKGAAQGDQTAEGEAKAMVSQAGATAQKDAADLAVATQVATGEKQTLAGDKAKMALPIPGVRTGEQAHSPQGASQPVHTAPLDTVHKPAPDAAQEQIGADKQSQAVTAALRGEQPAAERPSMKLTSQAAGTETTSQTATQSAGTAGPRVEDLTFEPPASAEATRPQTAAVQAPRTATSLDAPSPGNQVIDALRARMTQSQEAVTVRMDPPELGSVRVVFRGSGDNVTAVIEAQNSRTLQQLQQEMPPLLDRMASAGMTVRRVEFNLSDPGQGAPDNPGGLAGQWAQNQQNPSQSQTQDSPWSVADNAPAEATADESASQAPRDQLDDHSINVWM